MNVVQALQGPINRVATPAITGALAVSILLLLIACGLLLGGRRKWIGLALGVIALIGALAALVIVDRQTVSFREGESVTVTRPRHSERKRTWARAGMLGLPGVFGLAGLGAWASAHRRMRLSVPGIMKAARGHLFQKEYEHALNDFNRAIRIAPHLAEAYCGRGAAYQGLGDLDRALNDYNQAIQRDPRSVVAYMHRARIRTENGDCEGALDDLGRVMEIHPTDPELYLNRGICLHKKGLEAEAAADFHRVLKLTNHSDFAEPAKEFLLRLGSSASLSAPAALPAHMPAPQANGVADSTVMPEPKTEDYIL
jgi:tetratricopeptide (TPR) repeat protein